MSTGFQNVVKADEITLDISIWVGYAVTHPGLSGKIHYHSRFVLCEKAVDAGLVGNGFLDESPIATKCFDFCQTFLLEIYIVVVGHRVNADNLYIFEFFEESYDKIAADKPCCTRYKHGFPFE